MRATPILLFASLSVTSTAFGVEEFETVKFSELKWSPCDPKNPKDACEISYFRGNPEKEANHLYVRVPAGYEFPPHWHIHNEHVILATGAWAIGGENDSKGKTMKAGEYAYVPAKWIHWAKCLVGECVIYLHVDGPDAYIDVKDKRP